MTLAGQAMVVDTFNPRTQCLLNFCKILGLIRSTYSGMVAQAVIPALRRRRQRQEDEFQVLLGCILSVRRVQAT